MDLYDVQCHILINFLHAKIEMALGDEWILNRFLNRR